MIGVLFDCPGKTQAEYDAVAEQLAQLRKRQKALGWASPGLITHIAGPIAKGWRVIDVWESEQAFRRFNEEFLRPAYKGGGLPETQPQIFPVYNFVRF